MNEREHKNLKNSLGILANTSVIVLIGVILSKIFTYAYRIIIARHFGPEIYGIFALAIMTTGWFIIFATIGLTKGLARYIPLYRGEKDTKKIRFIVKSIINILLVSSFLLGTILYFISDYIAIGIFKEPELAIFLKLFSITIPITVLMNIYLATIQAYEKTSWYSFIFNIFQNLIKVLLLAIFIFLGLKTSSITFSYIIGLALSLLLAYLVCKYVIKEVFGQYSLNKKDKSAIFREVFSYSWPLLFFGVIDTIFYRTDTFTIGYLLGAKEVGFYNSAVPIAFALMLSSELFMQLFFPLATREYSQKKVGIVKELSKQVGKWIFTINLPIALFIVICPEIFIKVLFGQEYLVASNSLSLLAIGFAFSSVFSVSNRLVSVVGKSKTILFDIISACLLNLILNFIFIPKMGINGAALSTAIGIIFLNILFITQARHYTSIVPIRRKMINVALIALIPAAFVFSFKQKIIGLNVIGFIIAFISYLAFYFVLLLLFKGLDKHDLDVLKNIANKIKMKTSRR